MDKARITQLIARYVGLGLGWLGGLLFGKEWVAAQQGQIADWSGGIAAIVFAAAALFVSELIHRVLAGSFFKNPAKKDSTTTPILGMLVGGGALLALTLGNVGCSGAGVMRAAEYDGVATRVLDYTDDRAVTDPHLSEDQRREVLLDSALLRRGFDAGMNRPPRETEFERRYPIAPSLPAPAPDG